MEVVGVAMIRVIVRNGLLQPLDPLPKEWVEGEEIEIEGRAVSPADLAEIDRRWARIEAIAAEIPYDPEDDRRIEAVIADQMRDDIAAQRQKPRIDWEGPAKVV